MTPDDLGAALVQAARSGTLHHALYHAMKVMDKEDGDLWEARTLLKAMDNLYAEAKLIAETEAVVPTWTTVTA